MTYTLLWWYSTAAKFLNTMTQIQVISILLIAATWIINIVTHYHINKSDKFYKIPTEVVALHTTSMLDTANLIIRELSNYFDKTKIDVLEKDEQEIVTSVLNLARRESHMLYEMVMDATSSHIIFKPTLFMSERNYVRMMYRHGEKLVEDLSFFHTAFRMIDHEVGFINTENEIEYVKKTISLRADIFLSEHGAYHE